MTYTISKFKRAPRLERVIVINGTVSPMPTQLLSVPRGKSVGRWIFAGFLASFVILAIFVSVAPSPRAAQPLPPVVTPPMAVEPVQIPVSVAPTPVAQRPARKIRREPVRPTSSKSSARVRRVARVESTPTPVPVVRARRKAQPTGMISEAGQTPEWKGTDTQITHSARIFVTNEELWSRLWNEHHPNEITPKVDFSQYVVVGVFGGARPAEGSSVQIASIRNGDRTMWVNYREINPPAGTLEGTTPIYPYHLKAIPKTNLPIEFNALPPEAEPE